MLDEAKRRAVAAKHVDAIKQNLDFGGVEPGRRFVDHEQTGCCRKRTRDFKHPLLAIGERSRQQMSAPLKPHERQQALSFAATALAVSPPHRSVNDILPDRNIMASVKA